MYSKKEPEVKDDVLTSTLKKITRENAGEVLQVLEGIQQEVSEIKKLLEKR